MDDALAVNGETRTANTARSYYNRQTSVDDARNVYQHLNNGRMIVWINAAGEDPRVVQAAIIAMDGREPVPRRTPAASSPVAGCLRHRRDRAAAAQSALQWRGVVLNSVHLTHRHCHRIDRIHDAAAEQNKHAADH
jgi:hypothetical protein